MHIFWDEKISIENITREVFMSCEESDNFKSFHKKCHLLHSKNHCESCNQPPKYKKKTPYNMRDLRETFERTNPASLMKYVYSKPLRITLRVGSHIVRAFSISALRLQWVEEGERREFESKFEMRIKGHKKKNRSMGRLRFMLRKNIGSLWRTHPARLVSRVTVSSVKLRLSLQECDRFHVSCNYLYLKYLLHFMLPKSIRILVKINFNALYTC
jgi:hypothetical protein